MKTITTIATIAISTSMAIGAQWQSTKIETLYGNHFKVGDSTALVVSFSHANGWQYGHNFFWVDATRGTHSEKTALYGEFGPRFSFFKMAGTKPEGVFTDLLLATQIERLCSL